MGADLYSFTPRELANALIAYQEVEDMKQRSEWERTRWLATVILQPHSKKRLKPADIAVFPWEKKESVQEKLKWMKDDKRFPKKI